MLHKEWKYVLIGVLQPLVPLVTIPMAYEVTSIAKLAKGGLQLVSNGKREFYCTVYYNSTCSAYSSSQQNLLDIHTADVVKQHYLVWHFCYCIAVRPLQ